MVELSVCGASIRSIFSIALSRLWAREAVAALARLRSTKSCIWRIFFCCAVERRLLDRQPVLLLREVGRVVAGVGVELAQLQLEGLGDDPVEEVAVVAGDQDRAGVGAEELLEPLDAEQVEVVGRLVEQEQVVLEGEQAAQGQPHRPAAGEGGDRRVELGDREAQARAGSPWRGPPSRSRRRRGTPPSRRRSRPGPCGSPSSSPVMTALSRRSASVQGPRWASMFSKTVPSRSGWISCGR